MNQNTEQAEALRLAAWLKLAFAQMTNGDALAASNELKRLHAENETLRTGYDAARLEIESLRAQLDAVGAGGVEPLRKRKCLHQIAEPVRQEPVAWRTEWAHPHAGIYQVTDIGLQAEAWEKQGRKVEPLYTHPAPASEQHQLEHDEDELEQMYWEFDAARQKSGDERLRFKGYLRAYGSKCVESASPARHPLTDKQILGTLYPINPSGSGYFLRIARAIEAAHGIGGQQ